MLQKVGFSVVQTHLWIEEYSLYTGVCHHSGLSNVVVVTKLFLVGDTLNFRENQLQSHPRAGAFKLTATTK